MTDSSSCHQPFEISEPTDATETSVHALLTRLYLELSDHYSLHVEKMRNSASSLHECYKVQSNKLEEHYTGRSYLNELQMRTTLKAVDDAKGYYDAAMSIASSLQDEANSARDMAVNASRKSVHNFKTLISSLKHTAFLFRSVNPSYSNSLDAVVEGAEAKLAEIEQCLK